MTREAGNEVKDTDIIKTREVKDSRKAKFIDKLTQGNYRKAQDIGEVLAGTKYSYIFNDFGIPSKFNQDIFCAFYFKQLRVMLSGFTGDNLNKFTSSVPSIATLYSEKDNRGHELIWDKIKLDAQEKGVDYSDCNFCDLGCFFYIWLYIKCILKLNQFKETDTFISIKDIKQVALDTPDDMGKIIDELREKLLENPGLANQIKSYIENLSRETLIFDIKRQLDNFEFDIELETDQQIIDSETETETDEREPESIEDNTETEEDMADMGTRHSAFGVQIDFDIPDFIKVKGENEVIRNAIDNDRPVKCRGDGDFIGDFRVNEKSLFNHKIGMYANPDKQFELVEETVSTFIVLYCMANSLFGMRPDSTEEEVFDLLTKRDWLNKVKISNTVIANDYFVTKLYVPDGGNT